MPQTCAKGDMHAVPSINRTEALSGAMAPGGKRFGLSARVSTNDPPAVERVLERVVGGRCKITPVEGGFEITGEFMGESARELNRSLLSEMRRVAKRTTVRSEWTSGGTVEKFFDYVPKGTKAARTKGFIPNLADL